MHGHLNVKFGIQVYSFVHIKTIFECILLIYFWTTAHDLNNRLARAFRAM